MTATSVSIVVPCRNEAGAIPRFLESVLGQQVGGIDLEVIVADGHSEDATRATLARYCRRDGRLRVVDNPERGASSGLNLAIGEARGEVIIRMDAHTEYAPDYVRECVRLLQETGADNVGGPARTRARGVVGRAIAAAYHSPFSSGGARFHDDGYEGWVDTVPYGCWKKETLLRLGLFDEALVRNQDDELNLRITRSGGRIWQAPSIRSWYWPRTSLGKLFQQYMQYGYWKVAVIRKHRLPASWRHLVPAAFLAANVAWVTAAAAGSALGLRSLGSWSVRMGLALVLSYLAACLWAASSRIRREGIAAAALLPLVFPVFHLSYGAGFLWGLWDALRVPAKDAAARSLVTEVTR
ncbi:MAG: glycosyltransferase family 2 protein [Acidobacteria bacterium]|nr:MAG: glycosyltransferase family 2 protein [Acidobacteriota bacterium]